VAHLCLPLRQLYCDKSKLNQADPEAFDRLKNLVREAK
jgi:hypothetical protein